VSALVFEPVQASHQHVGEGNAVGNERFGLDATVGSSWIAAV